MGVIHARGGGAGPDGEGRGIREVALDINTRSLQVIAFDHHQVHAGVSFHVGYSVTTANSDDDVTAIAFKTPNTTMWSHIVATFTCSDPAEAIILEGALTIVDRGDGADKVVLNRNRNSTATSTVLSWEDVPTEGSVTTMNETEWTAVGISGGTELDHVFLQGGSGPQAIGGESRGTREWVLKQNTDYVFYLQNTGANANSHSISLDFYGNINLT